MPYMMKQQVKDGATVTLGAGETNTALTNNIKLSDEDSMCFNVDITVSAVTAATGVSVKIQDSSDGGTTWNTKKSSAVTVPATITLSLMPDNGTDTSGDRAFLPLRPLVRIVGTTGAGDALTVTSVRASERRSR